MYLLMHVLLADNMLKNIFNFFKENAHRNYSTVHRVKFRKRLHIPYSTLKLC